MTGPRRAARSPGSNNAAKAAAKPTPVADARRAATIARLRVRSASATRAQLDSLGIPEPQTHTDPSVPLALVPQVAADARRTTDARPYASPRVQVTGPNGSAQHLPPTTESAHAADAGLDLQLSGGGDEERVNIELASTANPLSPADEHTSVLPKSSTVEVPADSGPGVEPAAVAAPLTALSGPAPAAPELAAATRSQGDGHQSRYSTAQAHPSSLLVLGPERDEPTMKKTIDLPPALDSAVARWSRAVKQVTGKPGVVSWYVDSVLAQLPTDPDQIVALAESAPAELVNGPANSKGLRIRSSTSDHIFDVRLAMQVARIKRLPLWHLYSAELYHRLRALDIPVLDGE